MSVKVNDRQSNFELCRIISMFLIVVGHLTHQSGILDASNSWNKYFAVVLGSGAGIADNLFVMIGAYFLVDASFKSERILKLYTQVWTNCVPLTLLMLFVAPDYVGIKDVIRGLFPYSGSPLWFATCYMSMLLFSPFLNRLLKERTALKIILILLLFINVIPSTFLFRDDFFYSGEIVWFCFLYLLVGYYKKYVPEIKINKWIMLCMAFFIYLGLVILYFLLEVLMIKSTGFYILAESMNLQMYFIARYHTLPAFVCSSLLFCFFANINIGKKSIINGFSAGIFAIYILHQTPAFTEYMWKTIFRVDYWLNSNFYPLFYVTTILLIFIAGNMIDFIRRRTVEKLIVKSKIYQVLNDKITQLYKNV